MCLGLENRGVAVSGLKHKIAKHLYQTQGLARAIGISAEAGDLEAVEYLREKGAQDLNFSMVIAAEAGDLEAVESLRSEILEYLGGRVENKEGLTSALHAAARAGHLDVVKLLSKAGAEGLFAAMRIASEAGHFDVARYLHEEAVVVEVGLRVKESITYVMGERGPIVFYKTISP